MNKKLILSDSSNILETESHKKFYPRGHVIFKDPITGKVLYENDNKVLISGSQLVACAMFDINPWVNFKTYDRILEGFAEKTNTSYKNASGIYTPPTGPGRLLFDQIPEYNGKKQKNNILLFCCGTDGTVEATGEVKTVDYVGRIENIVPFKIVPHNSDGIIDDTDFSSDDKLKYVGKVDSGATYSYYFKTFENIDGNNSESGINRYMRYVNYSDTISEESINSRKEVNGVPVDAETFVELNLRITKEDFRDYFMEQFGSLSKCRINCISLCSAWREVVDGEIIYHDITPVTQLNIPDESLVDQSKGIDITYQVYF